MRRCPGRAIGLAPSNGSPDACASRWRTVEPGGPAGSSRSTTPSSAATSTASAATGFDTEARRTARAASPRVATTSPARVTPAAANGTSQASIWCRASTDGDTRPCRWSAGSSSGHSPYEASSGYSRAVVAGDRVHVSGTAPIPPDGSRPPERAYEQAVLLPRDHRRGARPGQARGLEHVVRTNIYVTDAVHWDEVARAHGETFGETRPAATCVVSRLLDDAWLVEIEAEAIVP